MRWEWDYRKNESNTKKHGLSFEKAQHVFDDPLALTRLDQNANEERWHTIGIIGGIVILVVHTSQDDMYCYGRFGRIISARKATKLERKAYEEEK